jgi:sugar lactone lactonase YvrE
MNSPTVVVGDRYFRVERPWGVLPGGRSLGAVSELALDSKGNVYVFQRTDPPVVVFDPSGQYLMGWGSGEIYDAHGIFIDPQDRVFLVDRDAHQILIYTTDGRCLAAVGERHKPCLGGVFNHPTDVAVAANGEFYVSDGYGNSVVHRFSPEGKLLQTWGSPGTGPGEFSTPHGIWIDSLDRVLVADRENDRIQLFSRDGVFLEEWGDLQHPMDIYGDAEGMIFVTDCVPRLTMFSPDGRVAGRCRPTWDSAHGVWGNSNGDLFLAEQTPNRVTKLTVVESASTG